MLVIWTFSPYRPAIITKLFSFFNCLIQSMIDGMSYLTCSLCLQRREHKWLWKQSNPSWYSIVGTGSGTKILIWYVYLSFNIKLYMLIPECSFGICDLAYLVSFVKITFSITYKFDIYLCKYMWKLNYLFALEQINKCHVPIHILA